MATPRFGGASNPRTGGASRPGSDNMDVNFTEIIDIDTTVTSRTATDAGLAGPVAVLNVTVVSMSMISQ